MAISKSLCAWMIEGVCSTSGNIMTMYKTNFNMPVPCLFDGSSDCVNGFMAARYNDIGNTSHALVNFCAGYEFAFADGLWRWEVSDGSCLNGIACADVDWCYSGCCFGGFGFQACVNINSTLGICCWQWYEGMTNVGIAGWEICTDATYCTVTQATTVSGDDTSIGACTISIALGGVPSVAQTACKGAIWVEGNNLNYFNASCWEHSIAGDCQGSGGTAGAIWIDNTHYLNWVNSGGDIYKAPWRICQFCSTFTNGPGPNPSPGAGFAGAIWTDTEFGLTHLAYIGCDGNKYLTGMGNCPYIAP